MKKQKLNFKNSKGITLIALVVTIVILLILAAVSLNLVLGNNGLITKSKDAKYQTEMAQIKDEAELVKAGLLVDDLTGERALNQPRLITAIKEHFEGSSLENGRIVTKDGKYDIIVKNNLDIVVVKHGEEYISEGEIGITYTTQNVDNGVEVTLYFEIPGILPLEEFTTEYLENKSAEELEELVLKTVNYTGSFEEYLAENNSSRVQLQQQAEEQGMTYEEWLKNSLQTSEWVCNVEYYVSLAGGEGKKQAELENLLVELIEYPGEFDDILEDEFGTTREDFPTWVQEQGFRSEEDFVKYIIAEVYSGIIAEQNITVEVSNGESFEVSLQDMQATYTITQNGTYAFTATGPNGETGEITIEISNMIKIGDYVNYTDKNGDTILCQILYKNATYGLQLVAVNPVDTVALGYNDPTIPEEMASESNFEKAKYSYNNAITTLNNKAEEYRNPLYTDEGGARCIGSVPNNPNSESEYFTGSYEYLTTYGWNGVFKNKDTNYNTDWNQLNVIGARGITDTSKSSYYWLASRFVNSASSRTVFYVHNAGSSGGLYSSSLCIVDSDGTVYGNSNSNGFRPVFSLKSTVKIKEGVGNGQTPETAFELEVQ